MIGIYKITNKITGEFYIGQSGRLENRLNAHRQRAFNENNHDYNSPLYKNIREYGIENFELSDKRISYRSFERMINGGTYSHLPIYKKKKKKWINEESCID